MVYQRAVTGTIYIIYSRRKPHHFLFHQLRERERETMSIRRLNHSLDDRRSSRVLKYSAGISPNPQANLSGWFERRRPLWHLRRWLELRGATLIYRHTRQSPAQWSVDLRECVISAGSKARELVIRRPGESSALSLFAPTLDEFKLWFTEIKRVSDNIHAFYSVAASISHVNTGAIYIAHDRAQTTADTRVSVFAHCKDKLTTAARLAISKRDNRVLRATQQHEALLRVIDVFETSDTAYIVTELVTGGSLDDLLFNRSPNDNENVNDKKSMHNNIINNSPEKDICSSYFIPPFAADMSCYITANDNVDAGEQDYGDFVTNVSKHGNSSMMTNKRAESGKHYYLSSSTISLSSPCASSDTYNPSIRSITSSSSSSKSEKKKKDSKSNSTSSRSNNKETTTPAKSKVQLSEREVRRIARDILSGLAHLHSHDIVHGVLDADHVICSRPLHTNTSQESPIQYKIATFSAACSSHGVTDRMPNDAFARAPEVICFQLRSASADIFAAAVLIHRLLTGVPPFQAQLEEDFLSAVSHGTSGPAWEALPAVIRPLLAAMLREKKEDRPSAKACLRHAWFVKDRGDENNPNSLDVLDDEDAFGMDEHENGFWTGHVNELKNNRWNDSDDEDESSEHERDMLLVNSNHLRKPPSSNRDLVDFDSSSISGEAISSANADDDAGESCDVNETDAAAADTNAHKDTKDDCQAMDVSVGQRGNGFGAERAKTGKAKGSMGGTAAAIVGHTGSASATKVGTDRGVVDDEEMATDSKDDWSDTQSVCLKTSEEKSELVKKSKAAKANIVGDTAAAAYGFCCSDTDTDIDDSGIVCCSSDENSPVAVKDQPYKLQVHFTAPPSAAASGPSPPPPPPPLPPLTASTCSPSSPPPPPPGAAACPPSSLPPPPPPPPPPPRPTISFVPELA